MSHLAFSHFSTTSATINTQILCTLSIYLHQNPKYNDYRGNIREIIAEGNAMSRTIQLLNNIHILGGLMPSKKKNYYLHY